MADRRNTVGRRAEDLIRATWHRFEWPAYARDTRHLCLLEHGAYVVLLREYYVTQAPLVANVQQLMYVCRAITTSEQEAVQSVLSKFFVLQDDGFHHERCDEEIARASQLCQKRHLAGHKGGEANAKRLLKREDKIREEVNTKSKAKATPPSGDVPEWIPRQDWQDFVEMRKKIRAPLTPAAQTIAINTLAKLQAKGHNPAEILQQSVMHSWRGLFEPRSGTNGNSNHWARGNPECPDCAGEGIRASKLTPGRTVICECVSSEVSGNP